MSALELATILRGALAGSKDYLPVGEVADAGPRASTVIIEVGGSSARSITYEVTVTAVAR